MTDSLACLYWSPWHRSEAHYQLMSALAPAIIKIMDGGAGDYARAAELVPSATIACRDWAMSEQKSDAERDPAGIGRRHAREWRQHIDSMRLQAAGFPADERLIVLGINEPPVWLPGWTDILTQYTIAFCDECANLGLRAGAMQLSVGWPANSGPDTPPDWSVFPGVEDAIQRSGAVLVVHEYWALNGPRENLGWWAARIKKCPWQVLYFIGECGVDLGVAGATWDGNRGWQGHMDANRYADELAEYVRLMAEDSRFLGACAFELDYANKEWWSFNVEPAWQQIVERCAGITAAPTKPVPPVVPMPPIVGPTQPNTKPQPNLPPKPRRIVWPVEGTITQWFKPNEHEGLDIAAPAGTPVAAMADGVVEVNDVDQWLGNYVRIWHPQLGAHTVYAHLSRIDVEQTASVKAGDQIGAVGSTGNSTGNHLHFEFRIGMRHAYAPVKTGFTRGQVDPYSATQALMAEQE